MAGMAIDDPFKCAHTNGINKTGTEVYWRCEDCNEPMRWVAISTFEELKNNPLMSVIPAAETTKVEELPYILQVLLPEWRKQFAQANAEYGNKDHLGPRGAFVDINRKTKKLRSALWDGVELKREQPREVAMDMIGHLFLLVYLMDMEAES